MCVLTVLDTLLPVPAYAAATAACHSEQHADENATRGGTSPHQFTRIDLQVCRDAARNAPDTHNASAAALRVTPPADPACLLLLLPPLLKLPLLPCSFKEDLGISLEL
jgi:hypothetical protein